MPQAMPVPPLWYEHEGEQPENYLPDIPQWGPQGWGDATYHGPSIMYYYTESRSSEVGLRSWWVNCHTPVNEHEVDLCSAVIISSLTDEPLTPEFAQLYPQMAHVAFGQDVEIWKDKVYR